MRDLLRLLGIAVLVFAIVGFAMIYSRDSAFRYGMSAFFNGTVGAVGRGLSDLVGLGDNSGEPKLESTTLRIVRPSQTSWVGLTGFPDQTVVHFTVPRVGGYVDGQLDLHFDVQLAQGGDGLLSVAVNGERRSEIVLDTGHNVYDVAIPLTLPDLLADRVVVELAARGSTNGGQICPSDDSNAGSAVSLLPESALVLTTLQKNNDPLTALIAAADPLLLYLGANVRDQAIAVWAAQHMARSGVPSTLVEDPLTPGRIVVTDLRDAPEAVELDIGGNIVLNGTAGLRRAIALRRADAVAPAFRSDWPVAVSGLTTETMARNFRGSKRWTIPYKIANLPKGLTPTRLELALRTSLLAEGNEWIVRVLLNGNLLETTRLPGNVPDIRLPVELPVALQGLDNSLVVELIDPSPSQSICRAGLDAQAQLLPETRLTAAGTQPMEGWGALVRQLAGTPVVVPGNRDLLSVNQATRVAAMLAQFLPVEANVGFDPEGPHMTVTVANKAQLAAILETRQAGGAASQDRIWIITASGGTQATSLGLNDLQNLDPAALLGQMHSTSVAVLVQNHSAP